MKQISNFIYCDDFLDTINIETKLLPNPYKDYPFIIFKSFLSKDESDDITRTIQDDNNAQYAKVKSLIYDGVEKPTLDTDIRKTKIYKLSDRHLELYNSRFLSYQKEIEDFFYLSLTLATLPQVLEYTRDCFYIKHSDDSSELIDKSGNTVGFTPVAPQRKITTVLFTTSHSDSLANENQFSGGELIFNYLYDKEGKVVEFKPEAGDMIVFPSNPYFSHEVLPVIDGYRLSIAQWHNAINL
jgi:SM-20-related protein